MSTRINLKRAVIATALSAGQFMLFAPMALAVDSTVRISGRPLFDVLSSAGGYSATARAEIAQKNLDNALVATATRGPGAVNITYTKGQPVLTLGGYYIMTIDNASAKAAGTTPSVLASRMAVQLKAAMSDTASVEAYVAQLTGGERTYAQTLPIEPIVDVQAVTPVVPETTFVHLPAGLTLPVVLRTGITSDSARPGDVVEASLAQDVRLSDGSVIPAGTLVLGHVSAVEDGGMFSGRGNLQLTFDSLRTSNGTTIPIAAQVIGGVSVAQRQGMFGRYFNQENTFARTLTRGGLGAGLGAALGTAIGAIAGGGRGVGRGAWSGAAIGGGVGALSAFIFRPDTDVQFPSGQALQLQLTAPAQVAVTGGYL